MTMETTAVSFKTKPKRYDEANNVYIGAMHVAEYGGHYFVRPAVTAPEVFAQDAFAYFNSMNGGTDG